MKLKMSLHPHLLRLSGKFLFKNGPKTFLKPPKKFFIAKIPQFRPTTTRKTLKYTSDHTILYL